MLRIFQCIPEIVLVNKKDVGTVLSVSNCLFNLAPVACVRPTRIALCSYSQIVCVLGKGFVEHSATLRDLFSKRLAGEPLRPTGEAKAMTSENDFRAHSTHTGDERRFFAHR